MSGQSRPTRAASHRDSHNSSKDWSSSPAAIFAACVLGIASLGGLVFSWNRTLDRENAFGSVIPAQSALVESAPSSSTQSVANAPISSGIIKLIDINSASSAQLDMLPGVGPAIASRIIADRDEHGPYESIDDLQRVSGIGPKTVEKLRHLVTIGNQTQSDPNSTATSPDQDG